MKKILDIMPMSGSLAVYDLRVKLDSNLIDSNDIRKIHC